MRFVIFATLIACGRASPQPVEGPRAVRTAEHLEQARKHDEIARQRTSWPARREIAAGDPTTQPPMTPWFTHWDPESDHARIARVHRSEVAANEAEFSAACGQREIEEVIASPLTRYRVGGWNTEQGVVVLLSPLAGTEKQLMADLRCHRAYLKAGVGVTKDSPLAMPGLMIDARGNQDGITLTLSIKDDSLIPELQRRVLRGLEEIRHLPEHDD